ncbi:MAG: hypothetical protein CL916_14645 [Deltaproteobacteria bacterium]|nr:hypothetical protein [Deltaproteobacteria bacterium]
MALRNSQKAVLAITGATFIGALAYAYNNPNSSSFGYSQNNLIELKQSRNSLLNQLEGEYGSTPIIQNVQGWLSNSPGLTQYLGTPNVKILEDCAFRYTCINVGMGTRTLMLTQEAENFFSQPSVVQRCTKYARMEQTIIQKTLNNNTVSNVDVCLPFLINIYSQNGR